MPTVAPQAPIARLRSRGSVKTFVMIDIATGLSIEPPTPCKARAAISQPSVGATLQASEPAANTNRPVWNVRRRPSRSPVEPASINRLASTIV